MSEEEKQPKKGEQAPKNQGSEAEEKSRPERKSEGEKKTPSRGKPASPASKKKAPARRPRRVQRGPTYEDLEDDALLERLKERFGEAILSGQSFLKQSIYTVSLDALYDIMLDLRDDPDSSFNYLVDVTALDHLGDEKRFCMVYHLYSYKTGQLIRVKSRLEEDEMVPSVSSIWRTAQWLEREVYDLFGIEFYGHPKLKRILLPDDWHGYPLRKDYDIKLQDQAWIKGHLRIRKTPV